MESHRTTCATVARIQTQPWMHSFMRPVVNTVSNKDVYMHQPVNAQVPQVRQVLRHGAHGGVCQLAAVHHAQFDQVGALIPGPAYTRCKGVNASVRDAPTASDLQSRKLGTPTGYNLEGGVREPAAAGPPNSQIPRQYAYSPRRSLDNKNKLGGRTSQLPFKCARGGA